MCACKHSWRTEGDFQKLFSPSTTGSGDCPQVIWLSWSVLYLIRCGGTHKHLCIHKHEYTNCDYKTHMTLSVSYLKLFSSKSGSFRQNTLFPHRLAWPGSCFFFSLSFTSPVFCDLATLPGFHADLSKSYGMSDAPPPPRSSSLI